MDYCELLFFSRYSSCPFSQEIFRTCASSELIVICNGNGTFYYDNTKQKIGQNDIILIPKDVKYRFVLNTESEYFLAGFNSSCVEMFNKPILYNTKGQKTINTLLCSIDSELKGHQYKRGCMITFLFNMLILCILRLEKALDSKRDIEEENFGYILNFLDIQSQNGIKIEKIAEMSGLSYHRFRHKFKDITGLSPQQYIIKKRILFAEKMLKTTDYCTSAIAKACGFNSVPQFITCFSKLNGTTPIKYRKQHRTPQ